MGTDAHTLMPGESHDSPGGSGFTTNQREGNEMKSGSWASWQAALSHEARAGGERDDPPPYAGTLHAALWAGRLTPERHSMTCDYWYTVTDRGGTPHTAFVTRAGLDRWLTERGLALTAPLDEPGGCAINGSYRTLMHLHDADHFQDIQGCRTRTLSNGDWVEAIISTDPDGIRTVHTLNPNVRDRKTYDYRESNRLMK